MMKFIINADDFGLTEGVNQAVFDLAACGALTSTSVMVNQPYASEAVKLLGLPNFSVGLHCNLTEGAPILKTNSIPSLVDESGMFFPQREFRRRLSKNQIVINEAVAELEAQFNALSTILDGNVSHLDSHQNIHKAWGVGDAFLELATKHPNLGVRSPARYIYRDSIGPVASLRSSVRSMALRKAMTECYLHVLSSRYRKRFRSPLGELHAPTMKKLELLQAFARQRPVANLSSAVFEIACHPAVNVDGLGDSTLKEKRVLEYECMCTAGFAASVDGLLCSFKELA